MSGNVSAEGAPHPPRPRAALFFLAGLLIGSPLVFQAARSAPEVRQLDRYIEDFHRRTAEVVRTLVGN
ncbi:hypothetical protein HY522_02055 [bacterium]|nr:hypothetical protein [bacterium]